MIRYLPYLIPLASAALAASFEIERVPNPSGVDPQIGGLDVLPDGRVAAAFHRGELMILDPETSSWSRFAEGLQEPLGLLAESADSLLVMQRAELTRLRDTDGDGRADVYETVFDDFGMSGNYHEFAFGPARGPDGALYIALNVASNGAGVRPEIRGEWSEIGPLDFGQMVHDDGWRDRAEQAGRMYARVAWRGWVLRVSPDGSEMEPYACGFRSPDGIGFDADGRLLVTDNQGDWRGTSPLHVVEKNGFHGHPASLVWRDDWDRGDPRMLPVDQLDAMRVKESARFPQGELANSPTQPVPFPESWGPLAGQTLIGEMNQKRMVRFLADEIDGFTQGALVPIFDDIPLGNGNHRLAFAPDGSLWVGKTHLSWAGDEGIAKITPRDIDDLFAVTSVRLEKSDTGHRFRIALSQPAAEPENVAIDRFDYLYHEAYGSPKTDEARVETRSMSLADDGRELTTEAGVTQGDIHRIDLSALRSRGGAELDGGVLYYQATELP